MKRSQLIAALATLAIIAISVVAVSQLDRGTATKAAQVVDDSGTTPPLPEHRFLQESVGTWDVTGEVYIGHGPHPIKGTDECRAVGRYHLVSDLNAEMDGETSFQAHRTLSYDQFNRVFRGTWVDSTQPMPVLLQGTLDATSNSLSMDYEVQGVDGTKGMNRTVSQLVDRDTKSVKILHVEADGSESLGATLNFKRRK